MEYRRAHVEGGVFFLTLVTNRRRAFLHRVLSRGVLREAIRQAANRHPFVLDAIVLLPDHLHMLMRLPAGDEEFSVRVSAIKQHFTRAYLLAGGKESPISAGREQKRYRGIWQPRFWEHTIRDAKDFAMHMDYIHANPLKHGVATRVLDWPWSSFHRYLRLGRYEPDWAGHVTLPHEVEYFYDD